MNYPLTKKSIHLNLTTGELQVSASVDVIGSTVEITITDFIFDYLY